MTEFDEHFLTTRLVPRFHFLDPREDEIFLEDIAHSLSLTCRYGGHCDVFYSVAEHSVRVAQILKHFGADRDYQLAGLLHDAEEAYLPDIPRPVKHMMPDAEKIYKPISGAIFRKFGVSDTIDWSIIKDIDNRICLTEAKMFGLWHRGWAPLGRKLNYIGESLTFGWVPYRAEEEFEKEYKKIRGA